MRIYSNELKKKQECIPVGCVPPTRYRTETPLDRNPPPGRDPQTETPLDRDPPGQRPSRTEPPSLGWRPPWTETETGPLWTDRHLCKHNLGKLRLRAVKMDSKRKEGSFLNIFPQIVKKLLSQGVDVNTADLEGVTPLHAVCREGNVA